MEQREKFSSRLGFILISAGCAIGLGNVWRFPYIVGQYGGAAFVLVYLVFLICMGLPIMVMEFSVGRASRKSAARSFHLLEPEGTKWHWYSWGAMAGNYLLMMFYTTVGGWMLAYIFKMFTGHFTGLDATAVTDTFNNMLAEPVSMMIWMLVITIIGFSICSMGLQNGVERITKVMMLALLGLMLVLAVRSVTLDGAVEGLKFYLVPNFHNLMYNAEGDFILAESVYAAMSQSFFTLSLGIGAMSIFGSYIDKDRSLMGEALSIGILDTSVALIAGLIIFPACFAFGVNPGQGVGLVFITLPNIFNQMPMGNLWGGLFFICMFFAALSTIIAVFENILCFAMDLGWGRKKAIAVNGIALLLLSMPCVLGFNVWSHITFPHIGNIQDLEDFLVSNNLLPLGSVIYLLFCVSKKGWGWDHFIAEADAGKGLKFPSWARPYVTWILPLIILVIFVIGYMQKFV
ncbi:MAG: sodium-dependent transporter [Firmicutes bacterium]|nr:sodium-dependent transporter [Bacillota bacterium]